MKTYTLANGEQVPELLDLGDTGATWLPWGIDPEGRFSGACSDTLPFIPLAPLGGGHYWVLLAAITYRTTAGKRITAPRGFVVDGASVPRAFTGIYPIWGDGDSNYAPASIFHDWTYAHRRWDDGTDITCRDADGLLHEIMFYQQCNRLTVTEFYYAVDAFGRVVWDARKPEDIIP